ncbi:unnamed protein product [Vitrella brassicaformis CCMP3155]|uniref:phenylalanine--tRNA ligase n=1 Tax=Vitrella brassicaformis (strain CCMP3155) TaxID=1169540 RepID=A0A0G4EAU5_VITBC|nr:unnamed protein product [Vitrella brassicaformis CCMP3155]|mmetsp:Transcript_51068/g.128147  ORF Transcript_51068/g.128147 Transcript_51068/m.128147 type:complete len:516 (-) Transcript_51068:1828-3375(-)|eukprot:CEL92423.1 unnamed protein product [Vitrella brassicaformis CCMP3155]
MDADLRSVVLDHLEQRGSIDDSVQLASEQQACDHNKLVGALKSLQALEMVETEAFEKKSWVLTEEAESYVAKGTPEKQVFDHVKAAGDEGVTQADLQAALRDVAKVGFAKAMQNKWVVLNKETKRATANVGDIEDEGKEQLQLVARWGGNAADLAAHLDDKKLQDLKKRKLVSQASVTAYAVRKGPQFSTTIAKKEADLTQEMILKGTWNNTEFKEYNFFAAGKDLGGGHLHPLLKVRAEFRQILLLMGFEEMPTNNWVESSFWNFDALFQPQQHPARDAHDTFFLTHPQSADRSKIDGSYFESVKRMHEEGGEGSIGWRYEWSEEESLKNVLRTHTTAVSSQMLYRLGQQYQKDRVFTPKKYFSIDRVFRNETLDATHLAEFHQVEGVVADKNLNLGHLIGIFKEFFRRIGITNLRFKPAYNPYTEPSMEIFGFHPLLNKWVEVGNSGIFRPEMLLPMGLPPDVQVIAWGLSLERPTMIQYNVANIRDLFGHKVDLAKLKTNPVCWLGNSQEQT